jgi:hypothetical protein
MYTRQFKLICEGEPKMKRFRIVTTQGKTFQQLAKSYNVSSPGFISATDDVFDDTRWEITTTWESKECYDNASKHPLRKMFWNRFELECLRHDIKLVIIDGETGESFEPLAF